MLEFVDFLIQAGRQRTVKGEGETFVPRLGSLRIRSGRGLKLLQLDEFQLDPICGIGLNMKAGFEQGRKPGIVQLVQ